ncbi:MAG: MMPL family transporter [Planctomycetota bacterium]
MLVLAALAAFVLGRLEVRTDIEHFLPGGEVDTDVSLARQLASGELSRTMVLLLRAPDEDEALAAGRAFEERLRAEPRVAGTLAFLEAGPPQGIEEALWTLIEPRRFMYLDAEPDQAAARLTTEALRAAVARLAERLASPLSGLVSRVAPGDPLLILPGLFEDMSGSRAERLIVADGRFLTEAGTGAVLFLGTRAASFDAAVQKPLLAGVHAAFDAVNAAHGGRLTLQLSGANRFAVRAEDAIRADIRRVSTGSMLGLTLLLLVLFRSLRLVLLTLPVVAAGFFAGAAACLMLYGQVHGLTLAFGAALIGVSIDYTVHFHCHQTLAPDPAGPRGTLRKIWPGLVLGAATTVVGFLALLVSSFPGLRELAVFAACGITTALLATWAFLPGLTPAAARAPGPSRAVAAAIDRGLAAMGRRKAVLVLPVLATLALAVVGLPKVRWNDDVSSLNRLDPDLVAEDEAVRAEVVRYEQRRLVVALGKDEQAALEANDRVARALDAAREAGELGGFRSAARLLPSAARQTALDAAFRDDGTLWPRMAEVLEAAGFVPEAFLPFRDAIGAPAPEPLTFDDVAGTPLESLVRPFRITLDDGVGVVSFVHDLADPEALARRLDAVDGARLIDIQGVFSRAYAAYRKRMSELLLWGLVAVVLLVVLRHRALRPVVAACVPALLGAAGTIAALALLGVELNFLSLVALLMIVSMGVDYGVFLVEAGGDRAALGATHLAVCVAAVSTVLGFGLLALSEHPSLNSIGLTSGVGVLLCLVLAPTVRLLARAPEEESP